jgi:hypothetical protein
MPLASGLSCLDVVERVVQLVHKFWSDPAADAIGNAHFAHLNSKIHHFVVAIVFVASIQSGQGCWLQSFFVFNLVVIVVVAVIVLGLGNRRRRRLARRQDVSAPYVMLGSSI